MLVSLAATAGSLGGLVLLFGVLLPVPDPPGCSTSIPDGIYADAMLPAHLLAAAAIAGGLAVLSRARGFSRARRAGLWAAAATAAVFVAWPGGFERAATAAILASYLLGPPLVVALAIRTALTRRARPPDPWRRHATTAEIGGWFALYVGIPAAYGWNYVNAASLFCF